MRSSQNLFIIVRCLKVAILGVLMPVYASVCVKVTFCGYHTHKEEPISYCASVGQR